MARWSRDGRRLPDDPADDPPDKGVAASPELTGLAEVLRQHEDPPEPADDEAPRRRRFVEFVE